MRLGDEQSQRLARGILQELRLVLRQDKGGGKAQDAGILLLIAGQRAAQIRLMRVARPFVKIDRIVALDQGCGDADRIGAIGDNQLVHKALRRERRAGVAQQHRRAAQHMWRLFMVALELGEDVGKSLDGLAGPPEPMQHQRRHRSRMFLRRQR
jgi:hypothetical protein